MHRCTCIYTELTSSCNEVKSYTGVHAFIQSLPGVVMRSVMHRCTCIYTELTWCCHEVSHTQVYMHLYRAYLMLS